MSASSKKPKTSVRRCSPAAAANFEGVSCFTVADLRALADLLDVNLSGADTKAEIHKRLRKHKLLRQTPEWNWIQHLFQNQKYLKDADDVQIRAFKPFAPSSMVRGREWLTSNQIQDYLRQLKLNIEPGLCVLLQAFNQDAQRSAAERLLKKNPDWKYIACVANTSNQGGLHWVTFFIDRSREAIEYFDSFGNPAKTWPWTRIVWSALDDLNNDHAFGGTRKFKKYTNGREIQQNGSECGVYAIRYVTQRVSGIARDKVLKQFRAEDPDTCYNFRAEAFITTSSRSRSSRSKSSRSRSSNSKSSHSSSIILSNSNQRSPTPKTPSPSPPPKSSKTKRSKKRKRSNDALDIFDHSKPEKRRRRSKKQSKEQLIEEILLSS